MNGHIEGVGADFSSTEAVTILDRVPRWVLVFFAGIAPAIMTLVLIGGFLKRSFFDFRPTSWNDQVYYWHQILSFSRVGFNSGYYMFYERLPTFDFFHFGASGFLYPALYGTLGRVIGWETYTGILLNMVVIALAAWVFIYVARLDRIQILLTGLFLMAVWAVPLSIPTIMQESFHQAAALVLAAIFYVLLRRDTPLPRWFFAAGVGLLIVISLVRFSWGLLFLPFFALSQKKWTWPRLLGALVISGILAVAILMIFQGTSAPGNNSIFKRVGLLTSSPLAGIEVFWNAVKTNLDNMLRVVDIHQIDLSMIEYIQFLVLLLCLLLGGRLFLKPVPQPGISFSNSRQWLFHLYNLISILGTSLIFYLSNGYYRVFAPHILLSGMLLIAFKSYRLVLAVMVIGLLGIGLFFEAYSQFGADFSHYTPDQIERLQSPFEHYLVYDAEADPWCNTLLTQAEFLDNRTTFVPAGFGISFFVAPADQPLPIKSQFLMLDGLSYEVLHTRMNLAYLADVPGGKLYRNLNADCAVR
jgi:hypothetical protein